MEIKVNKEEFESVRKRLTIIAICGLITIIGAYAYFVLRGNLDALMNGVLIVGVFLFSIPFTIIPLIKKDN